MNEEINILDYFKVIIKHWRLLSILFIAIEIVTLIFSITQARLYEATATILQPEMISDVKSGSGLSSLLAQQLPSGLYGGGTASQAIVTMLKSRRMAELVEQNFNLMAFFKTKTHLDAVSKIREMTSISLPKDNTISIKVSASDPKLAASMANFYATNLDSINEKLKISSVKPIATLLDSAIPPEYPSSPKVKFNLLIAGALALFVGILLSFFLEYFTKLRKNP
ncbi:MAG: Wzz/FepE/Etk N-terminal domain-containing protein [bacterium]|nr:Wzz/FepE/Etk N-terminal domain-containing protein [bacterium]